MRTFPPLRYFEQTILLFMGEARVVLFEAGGTYMSIPGGDAKKHIPGCNI